MASNDDIVLSYHDSLIRQSDYNILIRDNEWINDNLIEFWLEYLSQDLFGRYEDKINFFGPSVSQLIKLSDDNELLGSILDSVKSDSSKYILAPINKSTSLLSEGGSHWSLLAYNAKTTTFEHYDSSQYSSNQIHAKKVADKLKSFMLTDDSKPTFLQIECLQQTDSSSCGVHLMCNAENLCRKFLMWPSTSKFNINNYVDNSAIRSYRKYIANTIEQLKLKAEERQ